jgi:hypothetical protein
MQVAFLHFHLKTGGVTSVIARQVEAVQNAGGDALIISGEPADKPVGCEVIQVPQLAYDRPGRLSDPSDVIVKDILQCLQGRWPGGGDILHVHNPTLAKNRALQAVLKGLQAAGIKLLCQIHDFAEDGRPDFIFQEPYVSDCHYAVLNRRDYALLRKAGLQEKGLHLLPNPVAPIVPHEEESADSECAEVLYPVRAIRRKNIGEALLMSRYFTPPAPLAVTQPPNSPADCLSYAQWRRFAKDLDLNVRFEAGLRDDFSALVARCHYILTTSISEGFGFAFLEPWTAGKSLWGRILPDICEDFSEQGMRFDHMYEQLKVPLRLFDSEGFRRRWQSAWISAACRFGMESMGSAEAEWREVSREGDVDFGLMDERAQGEVIARIIGKRDDFESLKQRNPFLEKPGPASLFHRNVAHNAKIVARQYSTQRYADRLHGIYKHIITQGTIRHEIDKNMLIRAFLTPRTFSLLKWGSFDATG